MKVQELIENIKSIKKAFPFQFTKQTAQKYKGTVPNSKMKKKDLQDLFIIALQVLQQGESEQEAMVPQYNPFDCPICYNTNTRGLFICADKRHIVCYECYKKQVTSIQFLCALCKQTRNGQIQIECYEDDRPNINKTHILQLTNFLDLSQENIKIKWLNFEIKKNNNIYEILVVTDRFSPQLVLNSKKLVIIYPKIKQSS